ncbi:EDR2L [Scenedesmus sp. PABB004]|nr:EDR2L [Scenedesmus sp. PABB004]
MASDGGSAPLLEEDLYKHTVVADYVVRRPAARAQRAAAPSAPLPQTPTRAAPHGAAQVRRHVKLFPDCFVTYGDPGGRPEEFRVYPLEPGAALCPPGAGELPRKRRHVRPPGVGSLTALAAIRGKGEVVDLYTFKLEMAHAWSFRFCFATLEQAQRWHAALARAVAALRAEAAEAGAAAPAADDAAGEGTPRAGDGSAQGRLLAAEPSTRSMLQGPPFGSHALASASSFISDDADADLAALLDFPPPRAPGGAAAPGGCGQRWVPYRHSNGLSVYQHMGTGSADNEYMVTAIVRGTPGDVLRALLDPGSATSILGPALEVEVLESSPGRQVLRIQLQALGPIAAWFRPREAVVQRVLKKEDDGVYVVLFSSVSDPLRDNAPPPPRHEGVIEEPEGLGGGGRRAAPVRCRVSGGYTISKLAGHSGATSPETLLTCILQVQDLGGFLNPGHPLHRLVEWWSGGASEAFLERMLLGVTVARDVVEQNRFAVKPQAFSFQDAPAPGPEPGPAPGCVRTSTFVMRHAATALDGGAPPGGGAASALSPFAGVAAASPASFGGAPRPGGLRKPSRLASTRLPTGSTGLPRGPSAEAPPSLAEGEEEAEEAGAAFQLPRKFYEEIHTPGADCPFKVRGPSYLSDGVKVAAGAPVFELLGMEVVDVGGPGAAPHISRYLPSIRRSAKPFLFVFNLMVPGPPTVCCVFVFGADAHPDALGPPPDDPEDSDWQPFDFLIYRFLHGDDEERRSLFKMIPRVAQGSWVIKQSVGTTPVILGRKLATSFFVTGKYVEVSVDVGSSTTAQYVTGMVRGGAKGLVLDLGVVLEGHNAWELPEALLGAVRVNHLDLAAASKLDDSKEVPLLLGGGAATAESSA